VRIHEADAALARGEVKPARDPDGHALGGMRPRSLLGFLLYAARRNGLRTPSVRQVATFGDGATLDVPGSPRVVLVPGHTSGSAVLIVESLAAAFVGDAFATRNVMSGAVGPRLAPFGADLRQAYDSLARLEGIDSRYVLPGHGQPWTDGLAAAVARVRELGRP
jgi:glyoxylase-like metal-dependent hydrolase (beta-lactamase superfamily II)